MPLEIKVCLFRDSSDCDWNYIYVIHGQSILAQKADKPDKPDFRNNKKLYLCRFASPHLLEQTRQWQKRKGMKDPEDLGCWFAKAIVYSDPLKPPELSFFKSGNLRLEKWLKQMRMILVCEENRVPELPEWASTDPRIAKLLGMTLT